MESALKDQIVYLRETWNGKMNYNKVRIVQNNNTHFRNKR